MYSVIVPCYKSGDSLNELVKLLDAYFTEESLSYEIILVNDGSPDNGQTFKRISKLAEDYSTVVGIDLAKNRGQHNAMMCAMNHAQGDYIISMDDDMQTHPSQLPKLLSEIEKGYDVVYAHYPEKHHGFFRNLGSKFNSWTVRKLIGKPKDLKTSSFWVMRKFVRDSIIQYGNSNAYMQGLVLRTTDNIASIPVEHFSRQEGQSGYTLKTLIKLWTNIIGFSIVPLRMATKIGVFFSCVSIVAAIVLVLKKIIWGISFEGWTSTMVAICFFSGLILSFMGLIGEYIGRLFLASNNEPQYVIRRIVGKKN